MLNQKKKISCADKAERRKTEVAKAHWKLKIKQKNETVWSILDNNLSDFYL